MRGRVLLLLFSIFILSTTAFPQCDYHLQYSGGYRASIYDLWVDGNDLWAATGYGVQLFDRSIDPPQLVATVAVPGLTRVVRAANGIAYAGGNSGIAVVRKNGASLQLVRMIPTASVNDLILRPTALFAATTAGIAEFDLIDAQNPSRSSATFPTTVTNVTSIAATSSTLYAADGDASIEAFSIVVPSAPQKLSSIATVTRPQSVDVIGTRLYASDFQRTEVFNVQGSSPVSLSSFSYPSMSIAEVSPNVVLVSGNDRQIRAIDATLPENFVELFKTELAPGGGTVNRIAALRVAGGRLYVAGGDTGLSTFDVSHFASPFPVQAYSIGGSSSVVITPQAVYLGRSDTGIQELNRGAAGGLVLARRWSPSAETVHDAADGFLISSTGKTLEFWTLASLVPQLISTATFPTPVQTAFLGTNARVTALLQDGTLWTADMSQASPSPVRVATGVGTLTQLARSGSSFAATQISEEGNTTIHYWSGDLNAAPVDTVVPGISSALALDGQRIAVFTFRGITVVTAGTAFGAPLPGSNAEVVRSIEMANGKVLALTDQDKVRIWNLSSGALEKEIFVPGDPLAIDTESSTAIAGIATATGVAQLNYGTTTSLPSFLARSGGNTYYKKAVASASRLYLFDGRVVDVFEIDATAAPRWLASVFATAVIDIAASETMLFTLANNGTVTKYSGDGVALGTANGTETNATPLAISAVAGAPWVSFSIGCTTGNCEKRTNVLDPQSLVKTATLSGGIIDVATNGTRAYALTDLPIEIRVLNVADPLHPSTIVSRAADVTAVSIAANNGVVYLLGDKVYAYNESSLTRTGEQLSSIQPATGADLLLDSGCATIAGRSSLAETYALPQWSTSSALAVPGSIRSMRVAGNRLVILTDYSVEVWSRGAAPALPRRRAAQ